MRAIRFHNLYTDTSLSFLRIMELYKRCISRYLHTCKMFIVVCICSFLFLVSIFFLDLPLTVKSKCEHCHLVDALVSSF